MNVFTKIIFNSKGEHHLLIKNVSIVDNTKYQCQVTATDTEPAIKTEFAFVSVLGIKHLNQSIQKRSEF